MKISEVMEITSLTKKAINYYEENRLISPYVNSSNNYREYSKEDIDKLMQIATLRQLDISIKDIKVIIQNPEMLKDKFKQRLIKVNNEVKKLEKSKTILKTCLNTLDDSNINLPQLTKQLSVLNKSLEMDERGRDGFMKRQLQRIFPGNFGRMLIIQYSYFLNEPIDTQEKEEAWINLVKFLDEVESIEYPKEIENAYKKLTNEDIEKFQNLAKKNIEKWISIDNKGIDEEKEQFLNNIIKMTNDTKMQEEWKKTYTFNKQLNEKMKNIDFSNKFAENLKILSSNYKKYIEKMVDFSKSLNLEVDDHGNFLISKNKI